MTARCSTLTSYMLKFPVICTWKNSYMTCRRTRQRIEQQIRYLRISSSPCTACDWNPCGHSSWLGKGHLSKSNWIQLHAEDLAHETLRKVPIFTTKCSGQTSTPHAGINIIDEMFQPFNHSTGAIPKKCHLPSIHPLVLILRKAVRLGNLSKWKMRFLVGWHFFCPKINRS